MPNCDDQLYVVLPREDQLTMENTPYSSIRHSGRKRAAEARDPFQGILGMHDEERAGGQPVG